MSSIKNRVLELQDTAAHIVRLADSCAHEVQRKDGSNSLVLACMNNQVAQLQAMLEKAKVVQGDLQTLLATAQMRRPSISG